MYVHGVGIVYWDPSTLTPDGCHDAKHPELFDTVSSFELMRSFMFRALKLTNMYRS